jgi:UDP-N-acetylglucosamine acyltransferase
MPIHPSAIIEKGAEVDSSCDIGPFCVVGPRVKIGPRTRLIGHVILQNRTTLGCDNVVYPFACLGGIPQDLKYGGEASQLYIGNNNVLREYVTMNIGTSGGFMQTTIGNHCLFMASSHIAHDCRVGNHVVVANGVALAGHVDLHDWAIIGGLAAVHQFCRIGRLAFVGGGAMVAQDVPPFCLAQGDRASLAGINVVGLRRAGLPRSTIAQVHTALRQIFSTDQVRAEALKETRRTLAEDCPEVRELCDFIASAHRGVCGPRQKLATQLDA